MRFNDNMILNIMQLLGKDMFNKRWFALSQFLQPPTGHT